MAEVRIGKFGVLFAGVDLTRTSISFADLDDVNARTQLSDQRLGRAP
jgi:hypothetical protein